MKDRQVLGAMLIADELVNDKSMLAEEGWFSKKFMIMLILTFCTMFH